MTTPPIIAAPPATQGIVVTVIERAQLRPPTADTRPAPRGVRGNKYRVYIHTEPASSESSPDLINITSFVRACQWQHGDQQGNRIGGVLRPGQCAITLDNSAGYWSPFNPHASFPCYPGVFVSIYRTVGTGSERMFAGFSKGVQITSDNDGNHIAVLSAVGPMG